MKICRTRLLAVILVALWSGAAALRAAEAPRTADEILALVSEKAATHQTWTADYRQSMNMTGMAMKMNGTLSFQQPALMRMSCDMLMMGMTNHMLMVQGADRIMWQEIHMMGQTQIMKMDLSKVPTNSPMAAAMNTQMSNPQEQLKRQREMYNYKLLGSETVDGQPVYVLEGVLKQDAKFPTQQAQMMQQMMGKNRMYIGQRDGFMHKMEQFDKENAAIVMTMEFSDIKFNPTLAADLFQYVPAPDARVIDMTDMLKQMAAPPAGQPAPGQQPPAPANSAPPTSRPRGAQGRRSPAAGPVPW